MDSTKNTKVIGTAADCFSVTRVQRLSSSIYVDSNQSSGTVAVLGTVPGGQSPGFFLDPAAELTPEMAVGQFGYIRAQNNQIFLGIIQMTNEPDSFDITDLAGNEQIKNIKVRSVTPIMSAQFAA